MRFLRTAVLIAIVAIIAISDMGERISVDGRGLRQKNAFEKCRADPDPRYRRQQILEQLEEILKKSIPKDKNYYPLLQSDWEGKKLRFFVYDLTDPKNIYSDVPMGSKRPSSCIRFVDRHVYHFSPFYTPYSFSHITFLENGSLKVFKLLNCAGKGDSLDDVLAYLNETLKNDKDKDEVISRVKDYRKFGDYFTIDDTAIRCVGVPPLPLLRSHICQNR